MSGLSSMLPPLVQFMANSLLLLGNFALIQYLVEHISQIINLEYANCLAVRNTLPKHLLVIEKIALAYFRTYCRA